MKISRIYCNLPELFGPIDFNFGFGNETGFNVVFAEVQKPQDFKKSSHNLGKSTLISLIDFLLLKNVSSNNSFLIKHIDIFEKFVFYSEFLTDAGDFITVRRAVKYDTKIAFKRHKEGRQDFSELGPNEWDHWDLAIDKARQLFDSFLGLESIAPWDYRKGVSYFLRTQQDYLDYFQISKFLKGKDVDWKPYLARIFGFSHKVIQDKYAVDEQIKQQKLLLREKELEVQISVRDISKLRVRIENKRSEVTEFSKSLDEFSFSGEEKKINRELVDEIESRASELNNELYNINFDLAKALESTARKSQFKLNELKKIFEESNAKLPDLVTHDFEELVEFNRKITHDRNISLKRQILVLEKRKSELEQEQRSLDDRRRVALSVIRDTDTMAKYKALQRGAATGQAELKVLEMQLEKLAEAKAITSKINDLQEEQKRLEQEIARFTESDNVTYLSIAREFHALVKKILDLDGNFYLRQNAEGNIEFKIETESMGAASSLKTTSQSEGTTYKKLLCALFDLAVLKTYANERFFHFVYHDGVLEGLDNRKRLLFLEVVRQYANEFNIQYILSAIDSDLPRDIEDQRIHFKPNEIVLKLHDSGKDGRLFRMDSF